MAGIRWRVPGGLQDLLLHGVGDDRDPAGLDTPGREVLGLDPREDDDGIGPPGHLGLLGPQQREALGAQCLGLLTHRPGGHPGALQYPSHLVDPGQAVGARHRLGDQGVDVVGGRVQHVGVECLHLPRQQAAHLSQPGYRGGLGARGQKPPVGDCVDDVGGLSGGPADDDGVADAGHRPHVDAGVALRLKECVRAHGVAGLGVGQ